MKPVAEGIHPSTERPERGQWLEMRRLGIGGSDVAAIVGLNPNKDQGDVWLEKTRPMNDDAGLLGRMGQHMEGLVADEFAMRHGVTVVEVPMLRSLSEPWMLANVDRLVPERGVGWGDRGQSIFIDGRARIFMGGVECKFPFAFALASWKKGAPEKHVLQSTWYQAVTGIERWDIAAILGADFGSFPVVYDRELIDILINACGEFWHNYVVKDIPPVRTASKALLKELHPKSGGTMREAPPEAAEVAKRIALSEQAVRALKADIKAREVVQAEDEATLCRIIGGDEGIFDSTWGRATWKSRAGSVSWKRLAESFGPDDATIDKFRGDPSRKFKLKFKLPKDEP